MKFYYQVLSLASGETSPSLLLFFDAKRYLFNAGDGVQRLCHEHGISLHKISDIFLTSLHPESIGGLPGIMLTMMMGGDVKRRIHGPPGLSAYMQAASWFIWNRSFELIEYTNSDFDFEQYHMTTTRVYKDNLVTIRVIPFNASPVHVPIVHDRTFDFVTAETVGERQRPEACALPYTGICYIVEGPTVAGSFLKEKAKELGVKGGMFAALAKGESVTVGDRVVSPADVQEPPPPTAVFAILHLTGVNLTSGLNQVAEALSLYLKPEYSLCSAIHFSPMEVLEDLRYRELVAMMPRLTPQVVVNGESAAAVLSKRMVWAAQAAAAVKEKMHRAFPVLFPLSRRVWSQEAIDSITALSQHWDRPILSPDYLWKYTLSPLRMRGPDLTSLLSPASVPVADPVFVPPVLNDSIRYRDIVDCSKEGSDPLLLFLGTGSMLPGKYRNVSGIYLGEWGGGVLLDCGESSYSQLLLNYGDEAVKQVLITLKAIVITHMHADHHLGIARLIIERSKLTSTPVHVIAPIFLEPFLLTMSMLAGPFNYTFEDSAGRVHVEGLKEVVMVPVDHVPHSYGVTIEHHSGWKLVYSGDTRPCSRLVEAGQNATILVHEATFDDSLAQDAVEKHHSTMGEALEVARAMNVWKVILTHFSQRYRGPPQAKNIDVILAQDHLNLHFSDCDQAASLAPVLAATFMELMEDPPTS